MSEYIIEAKNISRKFYRKRGDSTVFYPVKESDFSLEKGKLTVLAGPSGSGKSTLLNMLAGILEPSSGEVCLLGKNLYQMQDKELSKYRSEHIGVIPQGQSAIQSLTVFENILLPYALGSKKKEADTKIEQKVNQLMEQMGIEDLKDERHSEMSGGEIRRMAIARALVNDPELILADEPTSDLDDENTRIVCELLKQIAGLGKAVLVVTHDKDVMEYADACFKMHNGELSIKNKTVLICC